MGCRRFALERIIAELREVEVLVGRGSKALGPSRQVGIAEQTPSRWRKECSGLMSTGSVEQDF